MAIKLVSCRCFEHPSDVIPVYSEPSVTIFAYRRLKWEYTWRNDDFFTRGIEIYGEFIYLFKSGYLDRNSDFMDVICPNRYINFKSIIPLQPFAEVWDWMFERDKFSSFDDPHNRAVAIKDYLVRKYATLLPSIFHRSIAYIKKRTKALFNEYGYPGIFLDYKTTPIRLDDLIKSSITGEFISMGDYDRREGGHTVDSKAIKVYDWKRYSLGKYNYDGDLLLSIDFSKTDETILNDIRLLIRQVRRENHMEPIYVDSEEREIRDKTKTRLSLKDYKTRLLGLWLVDFKEQHECGGYKAIEALRETGYIEALGVNDNDRAWLRLIAATERCIGAADVLPITSKT